MSKSYDNYIGLTDTPSEIYGRTLSIPDNLIARYFEYATEITTSELDSIQEDLKNGLSNPRDIKRKLARELVALYHDDEKAQQAEVEFDKMFIKKDVPDEMPEYKLSAPSKLVSLMVENKMSASNGESRRLISQGAVSIEQEKVTDIHYLIEPGDDRVLKVGKRKFLKLIS